MKSAPDCLVVACEILWDCFPDGKRLGGAAFNVAYHLRQLGMTPSLVASVGRDELGDEALRVIAQDWGCDARWIRQLDGVPTGRVNVTLNARGDASYEVITPAAWDYVEIPAESVAGHRCPLVYPSVGLRSEFNRTQVRRALDGYPGLKVFDANLRPPHNSVAIVLEFAALANFVKVNESELEVLASSVGSTATDPESRLRDLARALDVGMLCLTRAERPALLLADDRIHNGASHPVVVKDTVGAGDAFLASMVVSLSQPNFDPQTALSKASALGSWVASKSGAQPPYDGTQPQLS